MSLEALSALIFIWVSRYIAGFCLASIAVWSVIMYLGNREWHTRIRDAAVFLISIGTLTVVLALRPVTASGLIWTAVTWFGVTLLVVLELLWVSYLFDLLLHALYSMQSHTRPRPRPSTPTTTKL